MLEAARKDHPLPDTKAAIAFYHRLFPTDEIDQIIGVTFRARAEHFTEQPMTTRNLGALMLDWAVTVEIERYARRDSVAGEAVGALAVLTAPIAMMYLRGLLTIKDADPVANYLFSMAKSDKRSGLAQTESTLSMFPIADAYAELVERLVESGIVSQADVDCLRPLGRPTMWQRFSGRLGEPEGA